MKKLYKKYEEIIKYLFFGVCTTLVGWAIYLVLMYAGSRFFGISADDKTSATYWGVYSFAQVAQWIGAVLFAFFTNRKWVFTDRDRSKPMALELAIFAGGRVLTFFVDYLCTWGGEFALSKLFLWANAFMLFGKEWNLNRIAAKLLTAVIVIVANYFFSKLLVFGKKKEKN